ncbi:Hypothetical protein GLP15_3129 [Giardia lamblia P15]|uniref:Leucine-rich repeat protein n=1 Tax=Giardia intestinalis (strain P15) TaxID=658858 RepID=E1EVQ5_GIAIA|nr:Hypothetical protein GLP15_3129 [Giardia lamblia P15]
MLTFYAQIAAAERTPLVPSIVQQLDPFEGGLCLRSLGSKDLRIIFRAILAQPKDLQRLIIEDCNLSSLGVALSNAICSATELETLTFDRCQFAVNALYTQVLANLHLTKVKALSIINCKLTDSQLISFARTLDSLPYLAELSFSHNHVKDSTIAQLFKALQNYSLDTLDLRFCGLGFQSAKIILSFLDRYPKNIGTLLLDYNNFSTNLQNRLLQRCSDGTLRPLDKSQGSSRSSSRSPQDRRSSHTMRTHVSTKISGFHDDTLQNTELNTLTKTHLDANSGTRTYTDFLELADIQPNTQGESGDMNPIVLPSQSTHELTLHFPDTEDSSTAVHSIQHCINTTELTTFLNAHPDEHGHPLNVDFKTFKWSFSSILGTFQSVISSCQKRREKLGKADLRKMLSILHSLHNGSVTYNALLKLDMTYKLKCAEKRSDLYVEYQEEKAGLLLKSLNLEQVAASHQSEIQDLLTRISDLQQHIKNVTLRLEGGSLDEEISGLEKKISVTKAKNIELSTQAKEIQQLYDELLATEYAQQSSAAGYVNNLQKEFPVYAEAREGYCKYLYDLIDELLERVRNHKNELKGLLDAIRVRSI